MKIEHSTAASPKGEIDLYKITNANGASVTLSSLGAGIVSVVVPDKNGHLDDVALGYADPADYFYDGPCAGKVPGRYANRIARGHFTLNGKEYSLAINNGPNALHGGPEGYQNRIWNSRVESDNAVTFFRSSPDGEEGYPGNVEVSATYTWTDDNKLTLDLKATTDADTIVNLTNHAYWNLNGHNSGSVLNQYLRLNSCTFLPTDDTLIPTGEIAPVAETPMDFRTEKKIGQDNFADFPSTKYGKGYDSCWMIKDWTPGHMAVAAELRSEESGRVLTVETTQPAVQIYAGCWLAGSPKNKAGRSYNDYDGVAIECQHTPDAPNHDNFPSTVLRAGETLHEVITFKFSTQK